MALQEDQHTKLRKPIIFIGNPRSGTSVISEIVMRHKDIGYPSHYQNGFPRNTNINYFRRLFDNRFWRIQGQKKQLNKVNLINRFTFRTGENYPMWRAIVEEHIDFGRDFLLETKAGEENVKFLRKFFNNIVRKQGKERLAFKITGPSRVEYLLSIFPDAQFVRIHRKPIPTISSLLRVNFWKDLGYNKLWWVGAYTKEEEEWALKHKNDPVALTAFQTKKITEETDKELQKLGPTVLDIQYSDFVKDPEAIIRTILEYSGLSQDKACFDYFKENKIYNQNKKNEDYFEPKDLDTIDRIYNTETILEHD